MEIVQSINKNTRMKKLFLIFAILSASVVANAQAKTIMNDVTAATSLTVAFETPQTATTGSIQNTTSGAFDGTTSTLALQGSNDNVNWSTVFQDDNVTPLSFTLSAGNNSYVWVNKAQVFRYYRVVYTKGDATAGTIKSVIMSK